jgi:hypothetical protein
MPLPIILGIAAGAAAVAGVASGIHGGVKMKEANDTMKDAQKRHDKNKARFEYQSEITTREMDQLGQHELAIISSFQEFSRVIEKIQNRPEFKPYNKGDTAIPEYDPEDLKQASVGAGVLLGGLGGAAFGTAGGFAAAGATTAAVMALGTASTGTAIATLSGAAATNATLAALGGGAIAAGGGGMALGSAVLGAATLGVGLLVGGIIFSVAGSSVSDKADEAWSQMKKAEEEINKICSFLLELSDAAKRFDKAIGSVNRVYMDHLSRLTNIVDTQGKTDWNIFSDEEKLLTENTVLLVSLLYNMGKVQLVLKSETESEPNRVNSEAIDKSISDADKFLHGRGLAA